MVLGLTKISLEGKQLGFRSTYVAAESDESPQQELIPKIRRSLT